MFADILLPVDGSASSLRAARHGILIVMGSHRERGLSGTLLGSEAMKVLTHTNKPVLIYREHQ